MKVECPSCRKKYRIPDEAGGKKHRCGQCRHIFRSETKPRVPETRVDPDETYEESAIQPSPQGADYEATLVPLPQVACEIRLRVVEGALGGREFTFTAGPIRIGREAGWADLQLDVSRDKRAHGRHAEITVDAAGAWVKDLQTTNGTFLNDRRITQHDLRPGDRIRLGREGPAIEVVAMSVAGQELYDRTEKGPAESSIIPKGRREGSCGFCGRELGPGLAVCTHCGAVQ